MIRGYFLTRGGRRRPFVQALITSASLARPLDVQLLVDTGADRTVLAPIDARRAGLDLRTLPRGAPSTGVGGVAPTRLLRARLVLDEFATDLELPAIEPPDPPVQIPTIPSLLGRDIIGRFALFMDVRTDRLLLLDAGEMAALNVP